MRRRATRELVVGTGASAPSAETWRLAADVEMARRPRSAAGRWLRAAAVTVAITCAVLLAVSGSLLVYMNAAPRTGYPAGRVALGAPGAAPSATATTTPVPTATSGPVHPPAQLRSMPRSVSLGCGSGAPAPWPAAITSGAYGSTPNEVALTFDDGPTPYSTPVILSVLEQTHTPATFFVIGQYASAYPDLLRREWADGFAIGLHTWDHPQMTTLTQAAQVWELASTLNAVHNALGNGVCVWFWRPPYGDYNAQVLQTAASLGLSTVTWNDDPADWSRPGVSTIVSRVLGQVRPGSIILMHDGPAQRQETADALPAILDGLRSRGLRPVTLPKLLADGQYPGVHASWSGPASTPAGLESPPPDALYAHAAIATISAGSPEPVAATPRQRFVVAV